MPLSQRDIDDAVGRSGISIKGLIGAAVTALVLGFGSYLAGGANRADTVKAEMDVFRVDIHGQLALIRADQARMAQDVASIKAAVEKR